MKLCNPHSRGLLAVLLKTVIVTRGDPFGSLREISCGCSDLSADTLLYFSEIYCEYPSGKDSSFYTEDYCEYLEDPMRIHQKSGLANFKRLAFKI